MFKCLEREVQNLKATGQWGEYLATERIHLLQLDHWQFWL